MIKNGKPPESRTECCTSICKLAMETCFKTHARISRRDFRRRHNMAGWRSYLIKASRSERQGAAVRRCKREKNRSECNPNTPSVWEKRHGSAGTRLNLVSTMNWLSNLTSADQCIGNYSNINNNIANTCMPISIVGYSIAVLHLKHMILSEIFQIRLHGKYTWYYQGIL